MHQIDIASAAKSLPNLIEAIIGGEEVVITRENQPLVKLTLISKSKPHPQFGSDRGLVNLSDDIEGDLSFRQKVRV